MEGVAERALKGKGPMAKVPADAAKSGQEYSPSTLLDIPDEDSSSDENQLKERRVRE
ncbi:MAG TPA: hypothetical protein VMO47_10830 [Rhodothermales bacterium]|nr:hypothetical protein [Rhodothermales bacterium]